MAKAQKPFANVFLNIPYDPPFETLFLAYVSGVSAFGLVPRATLEIATSTRRLNRILKLIRGCEYSIHDLSRVQLDRRTPTTPRFNMPFELGLTVAHQQSPKGNLHRWFVCESRSHRLSKSLSDLNGTDPFIHNGRVDGVFRELCSMFKKRGKQPSIQIMRRIYRIVRKNLRRILREAGSKSLYSARVFREVCVVASASADELMS